MIRPLCETTAGPVHSMTRRDLRKGFEPPMTIADQVTGSTIAGTGKPVNRKSMFLRRAMRPSGPRLSGFFYKIFTHR